MALRSTTSAAQNALQASEIDELLTDMEKLLTRLRVMYEQYFLGIQKIAPTQMHTDCERKMRDLTQLSIRNTAHKYRMTSLNQKFGSYNSYWKRTMRDIEQGRYIRDLSRVQRQASLHGGEIPEEVLATMPKRMRDMVERDRKAALARGGATKRANTVDDVATAAPSNAPRKTTHAIDENLFGQDDLNFDDMFASLEADSPKLDSPQRARRRSTRPPERGEEVAIPRTITGRRAVTNSGGVFTVSRNNTAQPRGGPDTEPEMMFSQDTRAQGGSPSAAAPQSTVQRLAINARPTASGPTPPQRPGTSIPPPVPPRPPTVTMRQPTASPAAVPPPPGMSEGETRALYAKYLKARELVKDTSEQLTYDKLVRHLRQQAPKIMEAHKASGVEFGVVVKDNKLVIKAKPK